MPTYEYAPLEGGCQRCREHFEVAQRIMDPPLGECPECGTPVRRVLSAPSVHGGSKGGVLSKENLEKHGFTQYRRKAGGYEKTAGRGPDRLGCD